ncbi:MAG: DUF1707 and DUF2154 domain-containing protein [Pseudomonadales bacterium]|nr:DUF1707 and DUF2154 domain-containing protein [Pseudomonadales bacterium]
MPTRTEDTPIDTLREATIDRLIVNYGHGKLSLEAFERRLDAALEAAAHEQLTALTADLDLEVDAGYTQRKAARLGPAEEQPDDPDVGWVVSIFGGNDRKGPWTVPEELRIVTLFGGSTIDFTDARFTSRTVRVRIFCMFGGDDIYVPPHANVTANVFCLFGGVSNKAPGNPDPEAPRIAVNGFVMFGGTDIKVRKSLKARLREFADGLREALSESGPTR